MTTRSTRIRRQPHKRVDRSSLTNLLQMHIQERARRLAQPLEPPRAPINAADLYATFRVRESTYALPSTVIRETFRTTDVSFVPGAPDILAGLVNFRGTPLPVIDLSRLLGLGPTAIAEVQWILVVEQDPMSFGILADTVLSVTTLSGQLTDAANLAMPAAARELVKSVSSESVVVLDANALLSHRSLQFGSRL
jgi:purine-binding chemotaxis protein CheW